MPVLQEVAAGWPFRCTAIDGTAFPFYSISGNEQKSQFWCECHLDDRPQRRFDAVNAICDVVSALALALPAERPELICLHAAGVEMAGRLVVFPNIRKAGKSTLSAALARLGHRVFSDDVIPVFFTEGPRAHGLAMGISLRLRLPLPEALGSDFRDWVCRTAGPANAQYQYLRLASQPQHGETLPIGSFVILDRQDEGAPARLETVPPDTAMDALLFQNFTRDRHSADILRLMAATLSDRPVYRLTYSELSEATACLHTAFADAPNENLLNGQAARITVRKADADLLPRRILSDSAPVRQRPGSLAIPIGQTLYLADAEGRAIHRMDALASAIWTVIEEPIPAEDLVEMMIEAFPDAARAEVSKDIYRLLTRLCASGLVETA